jgi:hypothetical protein
LLIAQGLPRPRAAPGAADLDLGDAVTFVVRSHRWVRRLLAAALCLLFSWLILPLLLLIGYVVEVARRVRTGDHELPPWDRRWGKVTDGFKLLVVILIWNIPSILSTAGDEVGVVAAAGSVWSLLVLLLVPAIISQYLDRGFRGGLNVAAVLRRVRVNLALSLVVGALTVALSTIGLIGLVALLIGVLITFPYAAFIGGYLVGQYASLTDRPRLRPEAVDRGSVGQVEGVI